MPSLIAFLLFPGMLLLLAPSSCLRPWSCAPCGSNGGPTWLLFCKILTTSWMSSAQAVEPARWVIGQWHINTWRNNYIRENWRKSGELWQYSYPVFVACCLSNCSCSKPVDLPNTWSQSFSCSYLLFSAAIPVLPSQDLQVQYSWIGILSDQVTRLTAGRIDKWVEALSRLRLLMNFFMSQVP